MTQYDGLHAPPGPPDMRLGSLSMWVRGRRFSNSGDDCEANWPDVLIHFEFALDQSYLPAFIAGGQNVLLKFPVMGSRDGDGGARRRDF